MSESQSRTVKSPCISVCVLNEEDLCTGCWRSGNEISQWGRLNDDEKRQVLARCVERSKKHNPFV